MKSVKKMYKNGNNNRLGVTDRNIPVVKKNFTLYFKVMFYTSTQGKVFQLNEVSRNLYETGHFKN